MELSTELEKHCDKWLFEMTLEEEAQLREVYNG